MDTITRRDGSTVTYLSAAETAKLVRAALRDAFPGGRFSVRSSTYSGGASIRVGYTDGPPVRDVEAIVGPFAGSDFDGMIDMKVSRTAYLVDGRVVAVQSPGTVGSHGVIPPYGEGETPPARATRVRFGADFVFVDRELSLPWRRAIAADLEARYGVADPIFAPPGTYRDAETRLGPLPFGRPPTYR